MSDVINQTTKQESWQDWLPPGASMPTPWYTRDEIATLASDRAYPLGRPVTADDLQFWESVGVLPHAVRRWHNGATRAIYPEWFAELAAAVRIAQAEDLELAAAADRVRSRYRGRAFDPALLQADIDRLRATLWHDTRHQLSDLLGVITSIGPTLTAGEQAAAGLAAAWPRNAPPPVGHVQVQDQATAAAIEWANVEQVQAEIMAHLLAAMPAAGRVRVTIEAHDGAVLNSFAVSLAANPATGVPA